MSAYTEAQQLGLTGWVRNLSDGRVEILAEGEAQPLQALIDWSHRGPSFAQVINVEIKEDIASGEFTAFDIYR